MRWLLLLLVVACGGGSKQPGPPDAAPDAPPDTPEIPACREFETGGANVPVHASGALAGADLQAPTSCAKIDAPFGVESAGPDSVVRIDGLVPGTAYVVHLTSHADLNFYVVTGCSTPSGPSIDQCVLFEDANNAGDEVGRFIAPGPEVFVVVDYYASHAPSDPTFTLDVYPETCTTDAQCGGSRPVCSDGTCVECARDFDCHDAATPRCDVPSSTCKPGVDACLADDPAEPGDDGPAGATVLVPNGAGVATYSGEICADPSYEADYLAFDVATVGEAWILTLQWSGTKDLDLELSDATGQVLGLSYWEHPEHVRLTYLAPGRYYAKVTQFSSSLDPSPVPYTVTAQRALGPGCTSSADCATEYRNQAYRGTCVAGSCERIVGAGAVTEGGACDSRSDCATGLECPSFYFVANADTRDVCARTCTSDTDCEPLGAAYVCTTYLPSNFCVQKCTNDQQCPTAIGQQPTVPPWYRLTCELASGRCLP